MSFSFKRVAVLLLPPLLTDLLRGLRRRRAAPEWQAVSKNDWTVSDGWLHPSIVQTQVANWTGFSNSIEPPNPLGLTGYTPSGAPINVSPHNIMMTFGYVLGRAIATASRRPVKVLDWGGGVGQYALLAKRLYLEVALDYTVCELQPLAEAGRQLVGDVEFTSDGVGSLKIPYDLIYASSSLQYVRDVYGLLEKIAGSGSRWIMICRMPFVDEAGDFVVAQRPQRYGYDTEYTGWFLNRNKFVGFMQQCGYKLEREFLNDERPMVAGAQEQCSYRGFLFERSAQPD
jgi:putative methyltransferase (TIGR04325 family)